MTFLDFYILDLTTLVIVFFISLFIFMILNYNDEQKDENYVFNTVVAIFSGIIMSILYSYITIESDELLTTNYWD